MQDLINGRCGWCRTDELYMKYHDQEWGKLVTDDKTLFEFLVLESSQAGLSWITILRKREGYRKAFCDFDIERVAQMTDEDVERLMQFEGIVKNRQKIKSTITNARQFLSIQKEFGSFFNYTLSFFPNQKPIINTFQILRSHNLLRPPTGFGIYQRSSGGLRLPKKIIKRRKQHVPAFIIILVSDLIDRYKSP